MSKFPTLPKKQNGKSFLALLFTFSWIWIGSVTRFVVIFLFYEANPPRLRISPVALLSWAIEANRSRPLFCKEQQDWLAHSCSFLKSNGSELISSLFKKEQLSQEQQEQFALGHKKRGKLSKTYKKYVIFLNMSDFERKSEALKSKFPALFFGLKGRLNNCFIIMWAWSGSYIPTLSCFA